jgi:hypothetical protein
MCVDNWRQDMNRYFINGIWYTAPSFRAAYVQAFA